MRIEPSVHLQRAFSFSGIWYWAAAVLVLAGVLMIVHGLRLHALRSEEPEEREDDAAALKIFSEPKWSDRKCVAALEKIHKDFLSGRISSRVAWQAASNVVRRYVYSRTGVRVLSFTVSDLRRANMPGVENLIQECYRPAFEEQSEESPEKFIEWTEKLIKTNGML